jgi:hypothetical protein
MNSFINTRLTICRWGSKSSLNHGEGTRGARRHLAQLPRGIATPPEHSAARIKKEPTPCNGRLQNQTNLAQRPQPSPARGPGHCDPALLHCFLESPLPFHRASFPSSLMPSHAQNSLSVAGSSSPFNCEAVRFQRSPSTSSTPPG